MDEQTRKAWSRPELIVIVRGRSEETVLTACKNASVSTGPGTNSSNTVCHMGFDCQNICSSLSGS